MNSISSPIARIAQYTNKKDLPFKNITTTVILTDRQDPQLQRISSAYNLTDFVRKSIALYDVVFAASPSLRLGRRSGYPGGGGAPRPHPLRPRLGRDLHAGNPFPPIFAIFLFY